MRAFAKARTKAPVAERDFSHFIQIGDPIVFDSIEQYAAFALGIEHGSNPTGEVQNRKYFDTALKKMVND